MATSAEIEEGTTLTPKFGADGLVTAVVTDAATGATVQALQLRCSG